MDYVVLKLLPCFGTVALIMMAAAVAATATRADDDAALAAVAADDITAAEPSAYSPAYLPPRPGPPHSPYVGAVASASTNIIRTPPPPADNFGQVAAFPYPYAAGPYPHAAGPHPYAAVPYPHAPGPAVVAADPYPYYAAGGPFKTYGYGPATAPLYYGYNQPIAVPPAAAPYGYGPVAGARAAASHSVVTPHSVAHASFSGPYATHYSSYK